MLLNRNELQNPGVMPTYTKAGKRSIRGQITCLTCHKHHPSSNADATRSYLRKGTHLELCIDCHGNEAVWRYLYFHQNKRTPNTNK